MAKEIDSEILSSIDEMSALFQSEKLLDLKISDDEEDEVFEVKQANKSTLKKTKKASIKIKNSSDDQGLADLAAKNRIGPIRSPKGSIGNKGL